MYRHATLVNWRNYYEGHFRPVLCDGGHLGYVPPAVTTRQLHAA